MNVTYREYEMELDKEIDKWVEKEYSINSARVNMYAMFNTPLSLEVIWYKNNPQNMGNVLDKIIVFKEMDETIAYAILNYSLLDDGYYLNINPVCVNPRLMRKGYGKKALQMIIKDGNKMIDGNIDFITANLSITNRESIWLFITNGFLKHELNEDKTFVQVKLDVNKEC